MNGVLGTFVVVTKYLTKQPKDFFFYAHSFSGILPHSREGTMAGVAGAPEVVVRVQDNLF